MHILFVSRFTLALCLLTVLCTKPVVSSSTAARVSDQQSPETASPPECHTRGEEGRVLCEASRRKDESIKQVIEKDDTAGISAESAPHSAAQAENVWTAAYKQWIAPDGTNPKTPPKGLARALQHAQKFLGEDASASKEQSVPFAVPDLDDDELTRVSAAARHLENKELSDEKVSAALHTVEALCPSGDNGRQFEAAGGLPHLIRHALGDNSAIAVTALRALATCAQNNPPVFESAVTAHAAIEKLLPVAQADHSTLDIRAAALRALVAIAGASDAVKHFAELEEEVVYLIVNSTGIALHNVEREKRRCVTRAYALVEQLLSINKERWARALGNAGLVLTAEANLNSEDVDIREGAARVLGMLR